MNANELKELYHATPFRPFEIVLPNGSTVAIDHPEFMAFSRDYRMVVVYPMEGSGAKHIDIKLIIALNVLSLPRKRAGKKK